MRVHPEPAAAPHAGRRVPDGRQAPGAGAPKELLPKPHMAVLARWQQELDDEDPGSRDFHTITQLEDRASLAQGVRRVPYRGVHDARSWLNQALGAELHGSVWTNEAMAAVIRGAVRGGNVELLQNMAQEGAWDPRKSTAALRMADEAQTLMRLCTAFEMPLREYPSLAPFYRTEVTEALKAQDPRRDNLPLDFVSSEAHLLANFITVPHPIAETVMESIVEEMVIFRDQPDAPFAAEPLMPDYLGAVYLARVITEHMGKRAAYDRDLMHIYLQHVLPKCAQPLRTSPESPVTLPKKARTAALIPVQAHSFAHIYCGPGMDCGGFVYLAQNGNVLAVNAISISRRRHALRMGSSTVVGEISAACLAEDAQLVHSLELQGHGAEGYRWVGPEERLPGGLSGGAAGGFAFRFSGSATAFRFFPITGAGVVVDRADTGSEVLAAQLPFSPPAADIEQYVTRTHTKAGKQKRLGSTPITLARLKVSNPLNAVVLHALARSPRREVLTTWAAQGIASAAFRRAYAVCLLQLMIQFGGVFGIFCLTTQLRTERRIDLADVWPCLGFAVMVIALALDIALEVLLFAGYYRRRWTSDYISCGRAVHVGRMLCMVVLSLAVVLTPDDQADDVLRPLLAVTGASKWARVLWLLRGFHQCRLGERIIPIAKALQEIVSFVLFMAFSMLLYLQASFALSEKDLPFLMFGTYRFGFLGEWDTENTVQGGIADASVQIRVWQYGTFVAFSLLATLALRNIFVGVMANAHDRHHDRVKEHFVRERACIARDSVLRAEALLRIFDSRRWISDANGSHVWCCFPEEVEPSAPDAANTSTRSAIRSANERLQRRVKLVATAQRKGIAAMRRKAGEIEAAADVLRAAKGSGRLRALARAHLFAPFDDLAELEAEEV